MIYVYALALLVVAVGLYRVLATSSGDTGGRGQAKSEPEGTLHIKVIRADGTVEDHGTVPAYRSK